MYGILRVKYLNIPIAKISFFFSLRFRKHDKGICLNCIKTSIYGIYINFKGFYKQYFNAYLRFYLKEKINF